MTANLLSELSFSFAAKSNGVAALAVMVSKMRNGLVRIPLACTLVCAAFALSVPGASAMTIGSLLTDPADSGLCAFAGSGQRTCTVVQGALVPSLTARGGLLAGAEGRVTRWRVRVGAPTPGTEATQVRLRILDGTEAGDSTRFYDLPFGAATSYAFPADLPILRGQSIGLDVRVSGNGLGQAEAPIAHSGIGIGTVSEWQPALNPPGLSLLPDRQIADRELLLGAEVDTDRRPPRTKLTYPPRQDFLTSKKVVVYIRTNETAKVIASGQIEIPGPGVIWGIYSARKQVAKGQKAKLTLRIPPQAREHAARSFAHGRPVVAKVTVSATDGAGNESGTTVATVRPKGG